MHLVHMASVLEPFLNHQQDTYFTTPMWLIPHSFWRSLGKHLRQHHIWFNRRVRRLEMGIRHHSLHRRLHFHCWHPCYSSTASYRSEDTCREEDGSFNRLDRGNPGNRWTIHPSILADRRKRCRLVYSLDTCSDSRFARHYRCIRLLAALHRD